MRELDLGDGLGSLVFGFGFGFGFGVGSLLMPE